MESKTLNTHFDIYESRDEIILCGITNCTKEIIIPNSVTHMESSNVLFQSNLIIEKVVCSNNLENIWVSTFAYCDNLKEIIIPESVNCIMGYAFNCCFKLNKIKIENLDCTLNINAFRNTMYENIYIKFKEKYVDEKAILAGVWNYSIINKNFIIFLNEVYEDISNAMKYVSNGILEFSDITHLLDEKEFKGLKEGINYGI